MLGSYANQDENNGAIVAPGSGIDVTAVVKLKHADLWAAAKKMGNQAALAKHLEVPQSDLSAWINMKRVPPAKPVGRRWTEDYICQLEGKLVVLTGKSWDELFPESLRSNAEFLECEKTIEKTAKMEAIAMENYAIASRQRMIHGAIDGERREARMAAIECALESCNDREAEIVRMRFGLDGEPPKTLEEVARHFNVTRVKIRQMEAKAIRKMQQPEVSQRLIEYA